MRLRVFCPAKVNLFLSVGPRDERGYHPIRTIFQAVGLFDELLVEDAGSEHVVTSDWPGLPESNTITRTILLMSEIARVPTLRVRLTKRIPVESGLGGGSSDAAGLIRALSRLTAGVLPEAELRAAAAEVGADVPFFLVGGIARAEGYGERLTPLPDGLTQWLLIAKPEIGCPTAEMYGKLDGLQYPWRQFSDGEEPYNDFERVAPCECLDLIDKLASLGASRPGLAGSGSAVFGLFRSREDAAQAQARLKSTFGGPSWIVPSLSRAESLRIDVE